MNKLAVRIETTKAAKGLLPWIAIARHGRGSIESQFFSILGFPENELSTLSPAQAELTRETLEDALRLATAFEYIPKDSEHTDSFFEKKIVNFEARMQGKAPDLPTLHGAFGIVQGVRVTFATSGDILALQITPNSIVNLADISKTGPLHFETFRTGILNQHSLLLFIPKSMGTVLKSDELKNLHLTRASERKLEYLEHLFEKRIAPGGNLRAILIEAKPKLVKPTETTAISIANLLQTEAKTEALLSPPLLRPIIARLQGATLKAYQALHNFGNTYLKNKTTPVRAKIYAPKSFSVPFLSAWISRARASLAIRPQYLKADALLARFNGLPLRRKLLLLGAVTFLFVFLESVMLTLRHARIAQAEQTRQDEVSAISTLIDTASASLIYNDEEKTRAQVSEAQERILRLPDFQKEVARRFRLSSLRPVQSFITSGKANELKQALTPLQERLAHIIVIAKPAAVDEALRASLTLDGAPHASALYHGRRYELRPTENQIIRREARADGFNEGAPWIKDGTDVRAAIALTVDGSAYVLYANGTIVELLKGVRTTFALKPIDPPLERAGQLWTDERSQYLYLLDSEKKRLAVFAKKNGLLKAQYVSPQFTDLKDFSVDEAKKTAYLLDGTTIFSIPLSHFGK